MDNLLIRKLKKEDAEEISRIYHTITKTADVDDFKKIVAKQAQRDEDASFVAEINGKLVGYLISYTLISGFGIAKSAWVANLGVNPKYMGQGIGEKMAKKIFLHYRKKGIKDIYTSVRWDSTDLLSFFKTLGFDRSNFINLKKNLE
ncbi:MAG: GNAT family N-acetyltransferase [Pseudomonadota bacterium]|nr:GNAT family N-acetyltransferase [Pseudomonadota bacterium]MBU1398944.1 GNAT family N-acetyltransferase [Pseudomonadota bacterium]